MGCSRPGGRDDNHIELYTREHRAIQHDLDEEFFEPRYRDARQG